MQNLSWFRRWNEHFLFDLRKYFLKKVKFSVFFLLKDEINKVPHSKKGYEIRSDDGTDPLYGKFVKCFIFIVLDQLWFEIIPNKNGKNVRKVLFPVTFWIISITRVLVTWRSYLTTSMSLDSALESLYWYQAIISP